MIDEVTKNEIVECNIGYYDLVTKRFIIVDKEYDCNDFVLIINHEDGIRDTEIYKILYEFSAQDLADSLSTHIKYENNNSRNNTNKTSATV